MACRPVRPPLAVSIGDPTDTSVLLTLAPSPHPSPARNDQRGRRGGVPLRPLHAGRSRAHVARRDGITDAYACPPETRPSASSDGRRGPRRSGWCIGCNIWAWVGASDATIRLGLLHLVQHSRLGCCIECIIFRLLLHPMHHSGANEPADRRTIPAKA